MSAGEQYQEVGNIEKEKKHLALVWLCCISSTGNFAGSQETVTDWNVHTQGCNSIIQITCNYNIETFFYVTTSPSEDFFFCHLFCSTANPCFLLILQ